MNMNLLARNNYSIPVHKSTRRDSSLMKRHAVLPTYVVFDAPIHKSRHHRQEQGILVGS